MYTKSVGELFQNTATQYWLLTFFRSILKRYSHKYTRELCQKLSAVLYEQYWYISGILETRLYM